jgi:hypothetical protein
VVNAAVDAGQGNRLHKPQRMGLGVDSNGVDANSWGKPESRGEGENPKPLGH